MEIPENIWAEAEEEVDNSNSKRERERQIFELNEGIEGVHDSDEDETEMGKARSLEGS